MNIIGSQQTQNSQQQINTADNNHLLRSSAGYLANAFREGFKQNFLGYDIDMDFVIVSVRSLAQTSGKGVRQLVNKYSAAGRRFMGKRFYHNNTTLSHS